MKITKTLKKKNNSHSGKTKKNNTSHIGGSMFSITPKIYTNIKYGKSKSGYEIPELTCLQCKHNVFRHHEALHQSRMRAIMLNTDVFDKKYNIFVCYQCGFMMNYSGDIKYNSKQA